MSNLTEAPNAFSAQENGLSSEPGQSFIDLGVPLAGKPHNRRSLALRPLQVFQ